MSSSGVPFVDLRSQHEALKEELQARINGVIERSAFILGDEVEGFERAFAEFCGVRQVVGVANGTDALLLALRAAGIGPGDEVITAANTFVATAEAIVHAGATPVLTDVDPETYTIDVGRLESSVTERTKAIIPVHLYGQPADMEPILALARKYRLLVIEDAAQAHGARYKGQRVGTFGDLACFSFYPSKNLGALGDAGAVATNDQSLSERLKKLRDHGAIQKYEHELVGYNSRLDTIQAATLLAKLKHLDRWNELRGNWAQLYNELLSGLQGLVLPVARRGSTHVYHLYVVRVLEGRRDALRRHLQSKGIGTGIHYPAPIHLTQAFRHLGYKEGDFPVAERCAQEVLSLPMHPTLNEGQIRQVAQEVAGFLRTA